MNLGVIHMKSWFSFTKVIGVLALLSAWVPAAFAQTPITTNFSEADCGTALPGQTLACPLAIFTRAGSWSTTRFQFSSGGLGDPSNWEIVEDETTCGIGVAVGTCQAQLHFHAPTEPGEYSVRLRLTLKAQSIDTVSAYIWFTANVSEPPPAQWVAGEFGECTGGSGGFEYGAWFPETGCGLTPQTRTGSCSVVADSGTRERSVTCRDGTGAEVDPGECEGDPPPTSISCTPLEADVCVGEPELERTVELSNACTAGCVPDAENNKYCLLMPR